VEYRENYCKLREEYAELLARVKTMERVNKQIIAEKEQLLAEISKE